MDTALKPFQPKADRAEWRIIYDRLLEAADFGDVITYDELTEVLGRDFLENRSPIYRARTHLGEMRKRWIESEPGVGYRVIDANEHVRAAEDRKRRAKRQLGLMVKVGDVTDLSRLTPAELEIFDLKTRVNVALYGVAMHERRLNKIEQVLRGEGLL